MLVLWKGNCTVCGSGNHCVRVREGFMIFCAVQQVVTTLLYSFMQSTQFKNENTTPESASPAVHNMIKYSGLDYMY